MTGQCIQTEIVTDIELALSAEDCRTSQKQNWEKCIGIYQEENNDVSQIMFE